MSLVRIPVVNRDQLQTLRSLLRLDFTRAVRSALVTTAELPMQCLSILRLTEAMTQAEQPLIVIAALMQYNGTPTAMVPLDQGRFAFFTRLLDIPLNPSDFPGLTEEQLEPILAPMRAHISELKQIFENSGHVEEDALKNRLKVAASKTGMMN